MSEYPYPDNPGQTHWGECYMQRGHHNCAIARINELTTRIHELTGLLIEAQYRLHHTACIDDDATRCPACSLESRIERVTP